MRFKSNLPIQVLLVVFILATLGMVIHRGFLARSKSLFSRSRQEPRLILTKAVIVGWDQGERLWEFSGDRLQVDHENHYLNYAGHGIGKLYYKNRPYLTLLAPNVRYDMISKSAEASHGVRMYANPSTELTADELFWNQTSQRLFIPGKVHVASPYGLFDGRRLLFVAYEGRVRMRDVQMAVNLKAPPELGRAFSLR